jgi:hypothetical protein
MSMVDKLRELWSGFLLGVFVLWVPALVWAGRRWLRRRLGRLEDVHAAAAVRVPAGARVGENGGHS